MEGEVKGRHLRATEAFAWYRPLTYISGVALILLCALPALTAPPEILWIRHATFSDPAYPNARLELYDVVADAAGNVYAVGELKWDPDPDVGRVAVIKWDRDGNEIWRNTYAVPDSYNHPKHATMDSSGDIWITGERWPPGIGGYDWFIYRIASDGELLGWAVADDGGSIPFDTIWVDDDGQLVISGRSGWQNIYTCKIDWDSESFTWGAHIFVDPETGTRGGRVAGALDPGNSFYTAKNKRVISTEATLLGAAIQGDGVWVIEYSNPDWLHKVRLSDGAIVATLPSPSTHPHDLAWDGTSLWCADWDGTVYEIDPGTGAVLSSFGTGLTGLRAFGWEEGGFLAVSEGNRIHSIDASTHAVSFLFDGPVEDLGGICKDSDGDLWVSSPYTGWLYEIRRHTGVPTAQAWRPGAQPWGMVFDESGHLWNSDNGTKFVYECSITGSDYWRGCSILSAYDVLGLPPVEYSVLCCSNADTGALRGACGDFDLVHAQEEQPMAMAVDGDGYLYAAIWHYSGDEFTIACFEPYAGTWNLEWSTVYSFNGYPYIFPRDIEIDSEGRLFVVGRVGSGMDWFSTTSDSHVFTLCCDASGIELWRDVFDPGGPGEQEWGCGDGVSARVDGRLYSAGSASYSGTDWKRGFVVIAYGKTFTDTPSTFRVEASTGDVHSDGVVHARNLSTGSADVAEWVCTSMVVAPGDVLEHDPDRPGCHRLSTDPCSALVSGVASARPGVILGGETRASMKTLLALTGIVPIKVTNEGGPIQVGDLLVTASTPGHAMRWPGSDPCSCALVGKALEPMTSKSGMILILLTAH